MSKSLLAARILLGLMLIVFGLNIFLMFMPMPETMPERIVTFFTGLTASGYMMPMIGVLKILVGILLLLNRYVAFAMVLLAPFSVNIVLVHLFMDPAGVVPAIAVALLNIFIAYCHKEKYTPLFSAK